LAQIEAGAQEVKERIDAGEPVVLLDVRQPEEVAAGIIPGALHIPLPELEDRWSEVKDCDEVVCVCAKGGRSLQAATFLRTRGVFNATSLVGGMAAWHELGGTTVTPGG
jgi:rhodanese-related sulfurtransferase